MSQSKESRKRPSWILLGVLLGLLNTFAVATYGSLGISRNYVTLDGMLLKAMGSSLPDTSSYFQSVPLVNNWLFMLAIGVILGGFLGGLIRGELTTRAVPELWASRFNSSVPKRFAVAFLGGFLMLFGARLARGCTSGLVLSGAAQLAIAGFVFGISIFLTGIITSKWLYDWRKR